MNCNDRDFLGLTPADRMALSRRTFLKGSASGIGLAALGSVLGSAAFAAAPGTAPHFKPKAKRIIYLFQSGAPSQLDLFDPKPAMAKLRGQNLPESIRKGQRLTTMTSGQKNFPVAPSIFNFRQHGQSGAWFSELMPHMSAKADEWCVVRSMYTEAINHDPAITFFQTGAQIPGRPSIGSWLSYGLGSVNKDLPDFVAMVSRGSGRPNCQPLYDRLWGSGFLPTQHAGVKFMSIGDPVLYLSNPKGFTATSRRKMLDDLAELNHRKLDEFADPEIATRIKQYELAYRMQTSVPELTDLSDEPQSILDMYGPDVKRRGSYAYNCLMARRLAERDVRFVQLFHMGWDQHFTLPTQLPGQCRDTDQPSAALIKDLKMRGMLEDTLVVWGGEFGRTSYCQGKLARDNYGRDHHPRCFSIWAAGGGIKPGMTFGATDDYSYNILEKPIHVHDLHATILNQLGIDHEKLTYKFQGRQFRLTDVHGHVVKEILA
jgi:hypothetical protein